MNAETIETITAIASLAAAVTGVVTAVIAVVALRKQIEQARFVQGVEILLRMNERFCSTEMIETRRLAARGLIAGAPGAAEDLLNYFDLVGVLAEGGAIPLDMLWHDRGTWVLQYYLASEDHIKERRKEDPNLWNKFTWLYEQLLAIELQQRPLSAAPSSSADRKKAVAAALAADLPAFLKRESD